MSLKLDDVRHVAQLARLALTSEEEARLQVELSRILDAFELLEGVDTSRVEPTTQVSASNDSNADTRVSASNDSNADTRVSASNEALRPDAVLPSLGPEEALANAPARAGTSFCVPKVLE